MMTYVWAHRGASGYAPENTLEAFALADKMKADGIELDVHLSKDGEIIVTHDENVQRVTCGVDAMVKDLTLAELKKLDVYNGIEGYRNVRIPTLPEVLDFLEDQQSLSRTSSLRPASCSTTALNKRPLTPCAPPVCRIA